MGAAGASAYGTPAVRVKLLSTGADVVVSDVRDLAALSESFAPGDIIKRAKLDGVEEDATVRAQRRCTHERCIAIARAGAHA